MDSDNSRIAEEPSSHKIESTKPVPEHIKEYLKRYSGFLIETSKITDEGTHYGNQNSDDEIISKKVKLKYSDHPGFPKDAASKARFEKYVYRDLRLPGQRKKIGHRDFRKYKPWKSFYECYIIGWFAGDWERFPSVLTTAEYDALKPDDKELYNTLCSKMAAESYERGEDDERNFDRRSEVWRSINSDTDLMRAIFRKKYLNEG